MVRHTTVRPKRVLFVALLSKNTHMRSYGDSKLHCWANLLWQCLHAGHHRPAKLLPEETHPVMHGPRISDTPQLCLSSTSVLAGSIYPAEISMSEVSHIYSEAASRTVASSYRRPIEVDRIGIILSTKLPKTHQARFFALARPMVSVPFAFL